MSVSAVATGATVYVMVRREADSFLLNDADGAFASAPVDPYVSTTENSTLKGLYEKSESRTSWSDGDYTVHFYKQIGGSPAPVSDGLLASGLLPVKSDAELGLSALSILIQGFQVGGVMLKGAITALAKKVQDILDTELGKIRPAILDLQQSFLRGPRK